MSLPVTLFFAVGTGVELFLLKLVSDYISVVNTLSLIMLTFLIGIVVGRSYGKEYFDKMQWHLKSRSIPEDEAVDGAVMSVANRCASAMVSATNVLLAHSTGASAVSLYSRPPRIARAGLTFVT